MYHQTRHPVISRSSLWGPRNTWLPQTTDLLINCSACLSRDESAGFYRLRHLPAICSHRKNHAAAAWKRAGEQFGADPREHRRSPRRMQPAGERRRNRQRGSALGSEETRGRRRAHPTLSRAHPARPRQAGGVSPACRRREELQRHQLAAQSPRRRAPRSLQTPRSSLPWPPLITSQSGLNCHCKRFIKVCVAC